MVKPIEWFSGSPLSDALHGYDTDIALQALQDPPPHPAQKEETAMTATQHRPQAPTQPRLDDLVAHVNSLNQSHVELAQAHDELAVKVTRMAQVVDRLGGDLADLEGVVLTHDEVIKELQQDNRSLRGRVQLLTERLDALPQPKARERDETNDRIIAYLRDSVPGVWMTPTSIGANMKLDSKSVAARLDRLAGLTDAVVERTGGRGSGSHPLYRVVPPPRPAQPEA